MSGPHPSDDSSLDARSLRNGPEPESPHVFVVGTLAFRRGLPIAMTVLRLLVFMPALDADFVHWDDDDLVHGQLHHFDFTSANWAWMFTTTFAGHYQPLTWLTYAIDYQLFGFDPFGYHLTNVFWHLMTVFAFYFRVRRLLAVAAGLAAWYAQATGGAMHSYAEHDFSSRMAQASYGLVFYLWKTIWPTGLGPLYEIPHRTILMGAMFWTSLVVVAAVVVFAIRAAHKRPAIPAALAAYFVIVAPVLGCEQSGPQLVADRYSYLSCLGLAVLAGAALLLKLSTFTLPVGIARASVGVFDDAFLGTISAADRVEGRGAGRRVVRS